MGQGAIIGTISRAFTNQDGVTLVEVKVGREVFHGPLSVRGEPLDDLPGLQVRCVDSIWILTKPAQAAA